MSLPEGTDSEYSKRDSRGVKCPVPVRESDSVLVVPLRGDIIDRIGTIDTIDVIDSIDAFRAF